MVLQGHPDRKKFHYRDCFIRRQLEEHSCIRFLTFKWKLYALWQRLRKKISARKIANTYKMVIERRKLMAEVKAMAILNSAKKIQRYFRHKKLPLVRASIKIQAIYRGHICKGLIYKMLHQEEAAITIQRLMRGTLVRISDQFILGQVGGTYYYSFLVLSFLFFI